MWEILYRIGTAWLLQIINLSYICHETQEYKYHINRYYNAVTACKASAFIIPKDLPTIEALIALHKAIKKDEDKALTRVATSYGEQSLIEKGAESSMMSGPLWIQG